MQCVSRLRLSVYHTREIVLLCVCSRKNHITWIPVNLMIEWSDGGRQCDVMMLCSDSKIMNLISVWWIQFVEVEMAVGGNGYYIRIVIKLCMVMRLVEMAT